MRFSDSSIKSKSERIFRESTQRTSLLCIAIFSQKVLICNNVRWLKSFFSFRAYSQLLAALSLIVNVLICQSFVCSDAIMKSRGIRKRSLSFLSITLKETHLQYRKSTVRAYVTGIRCFRALVPLSQLSREN